MTFHGEKIESRKTLKCKVKNELHKRPPNEEEKQNFTSNYLLKLPIPFFASFYKLFLIQEFNCYISKMYNNPCHTKKTVFGPRDQAILIMFLGSLKSNPKSILLHQFRILI